MFLKEGTIGVGSVVDPIGWINVIPSQNPSRILPSRNGVKSVNGTTRMRPRTVIE